MTHGSQCIMRRRISPPQVQLYGHCERNKFFDGKITCGIETVGLIKLLITSLMGLNNKIMAGIVIRVSWRRVYSCHNETPTASIMV